MRALLAAGLGLILAGCSVGSDTDKAQEGIAAVHRAFSGGDFASVYDGSAPDMKSSISRENFVKTFSGVYGATGPYQSGKTTGWKVNYGTDGNYVVLNHDAKFRNGTGNEEFVFRVKDGQALLAGYHVKTDVVVKQ